MSSLHEFVEGLHVEHEYDERSSQGDDRSKYSLLNNGIRRVTVGATTLTKADMPFSDHQWERAQVIEIVPLTGAVFVLDAVEGDPTSIGRSIAANTSVFIANPVDVFRLQAAGNTDVVIRMYGTGDPNWKASRSRYSERISGGMTYPTQSTVVSGGGGGSDTFVSSYTVGANGAVTSVLNTGATLSPFSVGVGDLSSATGSLVVTEPTPDVFNVETNFADNATAIAGTSTTTSITPASLAAVLATVADGQLMANGGEVDLSGGNLPAGNDREWFRVGVGATIGGVAFTADEWYQNQTGAAIAAGNSVAIATAWTRTKQAGVVSTASDGVTLGAFDVLAGSLPAADVGQWFEVLNTATIGGVTFTEGEWHKNQTGGALVSGNTPAIASSWTRIKTSGNTNDGQLLDDGGEVDLSGGSLPAADPGEWFRVGVGATIGGVVFAADEWYKNQTGVAIAAGNSAAIATAWTRTKQAGTASSDGVTLGQLDVLAGALPAADVGEWFEVLNTAVIGGVTFTNGEWYKNQTGLPIAGGATAAIAASWSKVKDAPVTTITTSTEAYYKAHGQTVATINNMIPVGVSYSPASPFATDLGSTTSAFHFTDGDYAIDPSTGVRIQDGGNDIAAPINAFIVAVPNANDVEIVAAKRLHAETNSEGFDIPSDLTLMNAYFQQPDGTAGVAATDYRLWQIGDRNRRKIYFDLDVCCGTTTTTDPPTLLELLQTADAHTYHDFNSTSATEAAQIGSEQMSYTGGPTQGVAAQFAGVTGSGVAFNGTTQTATVAAGDNHNSFEVPGGFTNTGIDYDSTNGTIWIGDFDNTQIVELNLDGTATGNTIALPAGAAPQGVFYDSTDDTFWVADVAAVVGAIGRRIYHVDRAGTLLPGGFVASVNGGASRFPPGGVTRKGSDWYVTETSTMNIHRFTAAGVFVSTAVVGGVTSGSGLDGITYDSTNDQFWVAQDGPDNGTVNGTILRLDNAFAVVETFPQQPSIEDIVFVPDGRMFVTNDNEFHNAVASGNRVRQYRDPRIVDNHFGATVLGWFSSLDAPDATDALMILGDAVGGNGIGVLATAATNLRLFFRDNRVSPNQIFSDITVPNIATAGPTMYAIVADRVAGTLKLLINGVQVGATLDISAGTGNILDTQASSVLANDQNAAKRFLGGTVEGFATFHRVLSDAEILAIYNRSLT